MKILRYVMQPEIRNHRNNPLWEQPAVRCSGSGTWYMIRSFDMYCPALLYLPCRPGAGGQQVEFRILVKHLRQIFFKIRDVHFYVRTTYNVIHIFLTYLLLVFFWTLEGVEGSSKSKESPPPEDCKSLNLVLCTGGVTAKERTGLRHFFQN